MFDRDGFVSYVGDKSGGNYSAGLKYIENIYGISIDEEYDKDKCAVLLERLEQDKKSDSLDKKELKRRSDMTSHLKKYVEYRNNIDIIMDCLSTRSLPKILPRYLLLTKSTEETYPKFLAN